MLHISLHVYGNYDAYPESLYPTHSSFSSEEHVAPEDLSEDGITKAQQTIGKCSQNIFRSVTEISSYGKQSPGLATVDMDKALKGLTSREPASNFSVNTDSSGKSGQYPDNFCSECCVPGKKPPLDFTLKTKMRLLCSCSVSGYVLMFLQCKCLIQLCYSWN
ncbi:hypothetical protein LINPERHAP1_LOCUS12246 [Linum perenne]